MNTQIIAIANQKGGVGKTTTCANLGIGLAQAGKKVLLIDGDPQGSLTISLGNPQPDKLPFTLSDAMGKILMDQPIRTGEGILHHAEGVDLMPADIQLSGMEVSLVNAMSRETILRQYLDTLKGQYSHILIDCQPSLGMLTVNALAAANRIIIPVQAEYLPAKGLEQLLSTVNKVKRQINPKLQIDGIRYVEQDTVSIKRKKTISGAVIPRMAKANLQRNKRRTVFIVISLTLSIVLLNSVFIFSGSFDEDAYIENQTRSDFIVYSPGIQAAFGNDFGHNSAVPEKAVEEIKAQPGVTNEAYLYRNTFEDDHISCDWGTPYVVDNTNKEQRMLPEHLNLGVYQTENGGHTVGLTADNHPLGNVFGFSENFFDRLDIIEGETDLSVLKDKLWNGNNVILMGEYDEHGNFAGAESAFYCGLSVGDTIQFYENGTPTEEFTIIAKAAATGSDVTVTGGGSNIAQIIEGPRIFMAENKFKEIYATPTLYGFLFDVEEQYQQEMETYLAQDTDVAYTSILTMKATVSGVKNVVLLIGGMIGAVFALVGLINFINLVMTNIVTRRHEFAIMQSIGMTNQQLRKMMISESFSYVLLAGIVGALAAGALGMTLVRAFVENGPTSIMMTFQMTLLPALIMLALFLVLAFIVPVVALRLFNNRSVVERLRVNE